MDSIKDGFSILKGKGRPGSSVRTAIVKATKNDKIPPKEKHVKVLIAKTFENKTNMGHMIKHFNVRLETRDWITAAKALTVIHRIFREGNERFIKSISRTGILDMQFFQDDNFPRQTQFVLQYAKYLSEKAKNYRQFDKEYEKSSENFDNYDYKLILEIIPALQTQFEALLEFEDKMDLISSRISLHPFGLLLKDSFRLFTGLNKIFVKVIGEYDKMSKSEANHLLTFYKNFAKEVDSLIKLYSKSQSFTKGLPEIKPLPTTMIEILEDYIKGAPTQSRDNGSKREVRKDVKDTKQKEKPKEKVKKEKKPVVESESSEDGNGNENSSEEQDEGSENLLIDFTSMNKSEPMFNPMMFQNNFTQVHHQPQSQQLQQYLQQQQMLQQQQLQLQQQFVQQQQQQQQQQNNNVNSNSSFFNQNQSQSTPQNKTPQNFNTNVSTTTGSGGQFTFNNTNNNSSFFNNNNTNGSFNNNTQVNNNNTQNNNLFGNNNQNNNTFNNQNNQNNNLFNNNNSNTFNNNNNFNGNKNSTTSLFDFNTTTNVNTNNTNNFNNNTQQSGNSNNNLFNFNVTTSTTQGNNNNLFSSNPSPNAPTSTPLSQQPIMGTSNSNNNLLFTNNNNNLNNNNNNFMFNQNNHISNPLSNNYNINQNQNNMQYQFLLMQQQQQQQQQLNNPLFSNNSMQQPPPQRKLKESTPPSSSGSGQMDPSQQQFSFLNPLNTRTNPFAGN